MPAQLHSKGPESTHLDDELKSDSAHGASRSSVDNVAQRFLRTKHVVTADAGAANAISSRTNHRYTHCSIYERTMQGGYSQRFAHQMCEQARGSDRRVGQSPRHQGHVATVVVANLQQRTATEKKKNSARRSASYCLVHDILSMRMRCY